MKKPFNIIISGVGGQGLITLLQILAEAAFYHGFDVKTSELHGLSQRGGSVSVHIRFGNKVYSPMIRKADLILALEQQESLSASLYSQKDTVFVINEYQTPTLGDVVSRKQIENSLEKIERKFSFIKANEICQKELDNNVYAGVFLLGYCLSKGKIPLKEEDMIFALNKIIPKKYIVSNLKAFELGKKYET